MTPERPVEPHSHFVVLDACVLMPTILRRLLLRLAQAGVYEPVWSVRIGEEWRRNAARLWDVPEEMLLAEWQDMNGRFPEADPGDPAPYEVGLKYSDPKDWHVIAAGLARRARARRVHTPQLTVMTWNLKDFNRSELRRQAVQVSNPDALIAAWLQSDMMRVGSTFDDLCADAQCVGRPGGDTVQVLRRERLFRTANLWEQNVACVMP